MCKRYVASSSITISVTRARWEQMMIYTHVLNKGGKGVRMLGRRLRGGRYSGGVN
jgi:hypothetical protein